MKYSKRDSFRHFYAGIKDSLKYGKAIEYFIQSEKLQKLFLKSLRYNGIIFLGSVILLKYIFPFIFSFFHISDYFSTRSRNIFRILVDLVWLYPLYAFSFSYNGKIYEEISSHAYYLTFKKKNRKKRNNKDQGSQLKLSVIGKPRKETKGMLNIRGETFKKLNNMVMEQIILFLFMVISSLLSALNYKWILFGKFFSFFTTSWMYSYKSFNIVWKNEAELMTYEVKLKYFERHCLYFLGYGGIYSICTLLFPFFLNVGFFAFLFPFNIIISLNAKVLPMGSSKIPIIKIFYLPRKINEFIGNQVYKFFKMDSIKEKGDSKN